MLAYKVLPAIIPQSLDHLREAHGAKEAKQKITLTRRQTTEIKKADSTTGKARTAATELQRSTDIARLMAKLRGPTDLRANESLINADYAGTGGSLAADRGLANSAANVQAGTIRPDGTASLLGGLATSIGTGLAAKALKGSTPGTVSNGTAAGFYS